MSTNCSFCYCLPASWAWNKRVLSVLTGCFACLPLSSVFPFVLLSQLVCSGGEERKKGRNFFGGGEEVGGRLPHGIMLSWREFPKIRIQNLTFWGKYILQNSEACNCTGNMKTFWAQTHLFEFWAQTRFVFKCSGKHWNWTNNLLFFQLKNPSVVKLWNLHVAWTCFSPGNLATIQ